MSRCASRSMRAAAASSRRRACPIPSARQLDRRFRTRHRATSPACAGAATPKPRRCRRPMSRSRRSRLLHRSLHRRRRRRSLQPSRHGLLQPVVLQPVALRPRRLRPAQPRLRPPKHPQRTRRSHPRRQPLPRALLRRPRQLPRVLLPAKSPAPCRLSPRSPRHRRAQICGPRSRRPRRRQSRPPSPWCRSRPSNRAQKESAPANRGAPKHLCCQTSLLDGAACVRQLPSYPGPCWCRRRCG